MTESPYTTGVNPPECGRIRGETDGPESAGNALYPALTPESAEAGMNDSNARPQAVGSAPHDAAAISLRDVAYDIARYLNDSSQSGGDRAYSVGNERLFDGGMVMLEGTATDIDTMQAVPFILEIHGRTVQA